MCFWKICLQLIKHFVKFFLAPQKHLIVHCRCRDGIRLFRFLLSLYSLIMTCSNLQKCTFCWPGVMGSQCQKVWDPCSNMYPLAWLLVFLSSRILSDTLLAHCILDLNSPCFFQFLIINQITEILHVHLQQHSYCHWPLINTHEMCKECS
jgi:hypothetical protein